MSGGLVEGQAVVQVFWSHVVEGSVGVCEQLEMASLLDGEPVQASKVSENVGSFGQVQDESCRCILDGLETLGGGGVEASA